MKIVLQAKKYKPAETHYLLAITFPYNPPFIALNPSKLTKHLILLPAETVYLTVMASTLTYLSSHFLHLLQLFVGFLQHLLDAAVDFLGGPTAHGFLQPLIQLLHTLFQGLGVAVPVLVELLPALVHLCHLHTWYIHLLVSSLHKDF